jgi:hypothetical protein
MNKPNCYGKMDWILKYNEDEIPSTSICSCNYTNSCLRITNNKRTEEVIPKRTECNVGQCWECKNKCGEKVIILQEGGKQLVPECSVAYPPMYMTNVCKMPCTSFKPRG